MDVKRSPCVRSSQVNRRALSFIEGHVSVVSVGVSGRDISGMIVVCHVLHYAAFSWAYCEPCD